MYFLQPMKIFIGNGKSKLRIYGSPGANGLYVFQAVLESHLTSLEVLFSSTVVDREQVVPP